MLRRILFFTLALIVNISMASVAKPLNYGSVPNEFGMWIIRIHILLAIILITFIIRFLIKKDKEFLIIVIGIVIAIGAVCTVVLGNRSSDIAIKPSDKIKSRKDYIISHLFKFEKMDWNAITNSELNNNNIVRDVTKLYKKDIDRLLGTQDWEVVEKTNRIILGKKCIEWKIHFKDSNGREQEVIINNRFNPDELIISDDIIKANIDNLNTLLGEKNWSIKEEKYKHYHEDPYQKYGNYREWTIGFTNYKNEYKEITLQSDIDFENQIPSNISKILTDEAENILGIDYKVVLLPNSGPRTTDNLFWGGDKPVLDEISSNDAVKLDLRELNLVGVIKENGINIIVKEQKNDRVIEDILNKIRKLNYKEYKVKISFEIYFGRNYEEVVIISDSLNEKRYETKSAYVQPLY